MGIKLAVESKEMTDRFKFFRIKSFVGKVQTRGHNFRSDRQFSADNISNRPSRRYLRFDMLETKNKSVGSKVMTQRFKFI